MRLSLFAPLPALALALAACGDPAPGGQVIATVNGDEITRPQFNAALPGAGADASTGKDAAAVRDAVLDRLILQQLVVQEAKRQGIDRSQDYLLAVHAAGDRILSDLLGRKMLQGLPAPSADRVGRFLRDDPGRFAGREILAVEQIRYPAGDYASAMLRDARDLADIARRLSAAKVRFERGHAAIDTSVIAPGRRAALLALPPGRPFLTEEGGTTVAAAITRRRPAPIAAEAARTEAARLIAERDARTALTTLLGTLRQDARIAYQPGFAAPRPTEAAPPPPPGPR